MSRPMTHRSRAVAYRDEPQALAVALELLRTTRTIATPLGNLLQLRVGLHCGSLMTGVVGHRAPRFCCFGVSWPACASPVGMAATSCRCPAAFLWAFAFIPLMPAAKRTGPTAARV